MRENLRAIDIGQPVQFWIAVGPQEVVKRPGRQLPQLIMQKRFGHQPTGKHCRGTRAVALAVGYQREVDFDHFSALGFDGLARGLPQINDRGAGDDALPRRAADTR